MDEVTGPVAANELFHREGLEPHDHLDRMEIDEDGDGSSTAPGWRRGRGTEANSTVYESASNDKVREGADLLMDDWNPPIAGTAIPPFLLLAREQKVEVGNREQKQSQPLRFPPDNTACREGTVSQGALQEVQGPTASDALQASQQRLEGELLQDHYSAQEAAAAASLISWHSASLLSRHSVDFHHSGRSNSSPTSSLQDIRSIVSPQSRTFSIAKQSPTPISIRPRSRPRPGPIQSITGNPNQNDSGSSFVSGASITPRHTHSYSPYPHPLSSRSATSTSAFVDTSGAALSPFSRIQTQNQSATPTPSWLEMSSSSASQPHSTPPPPTDQVPPGNGGTNSRRLSPPLSMSTSPMSLSKRRRAPAWPSPRADKQMPITRDFSTLYTPAALKVPPTPQYSPAFHRSGYAALPALGLGPGPDRRTPSPRPTLSASASAPVRSVARLESPAMVDTGRVSLAGVPQSYVIRQLNGLAHKFWFNPDSADCRVRECYS